MLSFVQRPLEMRTYRVPKLNPHAYSYVSLSAYTHLGCWKDTGNRAVPQIDGSDPRIRGNYQRRANAINKCYQVARERKMVLFAIQHGGWCAAAPNFNGYKRYGSSNKCRGGKGGPWANDVYRITNPIRPAVIKGILTLSKYLEASGMTGRCLPSFFHA